MPALFDKQGIKFQYPENWTVEASTAIDEDGVTLYSPGGGFWSVVVRDGGDEPAQVAEVVLETMRELYDDLDSAAVEEPVAGEELVGHDVNFYCLDMTNTAQIRAFRRDGKTYLVLYQAEDREFDAIEPVFRAITRSLVQAH